MSTIKQIRATLGASKKSRALRAVLENLLLFKGSDNENETLAHAEEDIMCAIGDAPLLNDSPEFALLAWIERRQAKLAKFQ